MIAARRALVAFVLLGCGGTSDDSAMPNGGRGGGSGAGGQGGEDDTPAGGSGGAGGAPSLDHGAAYVRLANLAAGMEALDFCVAPKGSGAFVGPILERGSPAASAPVKPDGVVLTGRNLDIQRDEAISGYVPIEAGSYTFRIVAATATDCERPLQEITDAVDIRGGEGATVALVGRKDGTLPQLARVFVGEFITDVEAVRFINAADAAERYDFRLGEGLLSRPLHTGVARGAQGAIRGSAGGYVAVASWRSPPFSIGVTGTTKTSLPVPTRFGRGGTSVFLIGEPGSKTFGLRALVCADAVGRTGCEIVGRDFSQTPLTSMRFVHFGEGGGEDLREPIYCFGPPGGPYEQGYGGGGWHVTRYREIPAGKYRTFVKPTGLDNCNKADRVLVEAELDFPENGFATVMLVGGSGAALPLSLRKLEDKLDFSAEHATIRFVHAAVGAGDFVAGVGKGTAFQRLFEVVRYGSASEGGAGDALGYAHFDGMENGHVTVRKAAAPMADVAARDDMFIRKGETWTVFAVVGNKFNSSEKEVQLMACIDTAIPLTSVTGCRDPRSGF